MIHSGRSSEWIDTRSPGCTPSASSACAASSTCSHVSAHVSSRQMPKSFSRIATCWGRALRPAACSEATVDTPSRRSAAAWATSVSVMVFPRMSPNRAGSTPAQRQRDPRSRTLSRET